MAEAIKNLFSPTLAVPSSFVYLSDWSEKDSSWDRRRAESQDVQQVYLLAPEGQFERYAQRIAQCSTVLEYGMILDEESGAIVLKLKRTQFCRVRHCPVCQWRRSMMWQARFFQALPAIQYAYPSAKWIYLTLTVRNLEVSGVREMISHLNASFVRLSQRNAWPGLGWVRSLELTRGEDGSAHPHIHALVMVPPGYFGKGYLSHDKWVKLWRSCARLDYDPMVNVQVVKPKAPGLEGLHGALVETFKYSIKPSDMVADEIWFWKMTEQLHKTRFIGLGGCLRGFFSVDEPITDDELIHADGEAGEGNEGGMYFGWRTDERRYRRKFDTA